MKGKNKRRATKAWKALCAGHYDEGQGYDEAAIDLVTDLLHLMEAWEHDPARILRCAIMHFNEESTAKIAIPYQLDTEREECDAKEDHPN